MLIDYISPERFKISSLIQIFHLFSISTFYNINSFIRMLFNSVGSYWFRHFVNLHCSFDKGWKGFVIKYRIIHGEEHVYRNQRRCIIYYVTHEIVCFKTEKYIEK